MNKQLTTDELKNLLVPTILPMTRRERLMRLATIVRDAKTIFGWPRAFFLFHGLEYAPREALETLSHPDSVFHLASKDPVLNEAGLTSGTVGASMTFFGLSREALHMFSCDCGGQISNANMASRIEKLAA